MSKETAKIFLTKISEKIKKGDYDIYFTLPFMDRKLLFAGIKKQVMNRVDNNKNPLLSDKEIHLIISDIKITSAFTARIFLKFGFIAKSDDGTYDITEKGHRAIKVSLLDSFNLR